MGDVIQFRIAQYSSVFLRLVWPVLAAHGCTGYLSFEDGPYQPIDRAAGIDGFLMLKGKPFFIASRVQAVSGAPFNTFTIRSRLASGRPTEFHKLAAAFSSPCPACAAPNLTIHAYVSSAYDRLLSVGIVRTQDLYAAAVKYPYERRGPDGNYFRYLKWHWLKTKSVKVWTWESPTPQRQVAQAA